MAGGVALNSSANGRLQRAINGELFVQPAAGDASSALGAALYYTPHCHLSEALATPGAYWSVLFITLIFDALVVSRVNATFYPATSDRPSPFVYAMA